MSNASSITRAKAAEELLKRKELQENLTLWAKHYGMEKGWSPAQHHQLLLDKLQAVTDGKLIHSKTGLPCRNLMVLMPPGSAKSSYTSVIFPVWFVQRRPACRILACSYSADLIESFSRDCRNAIDSYTNVLGYGLLQSSRSIQEWATTNGGAYRCSGVGAGIAGRRADAGVIDDYIGTQEDADSKVIRDKQWLWYWGDFWPRLKPGAIQIIVANRRHEDDLVGRLLDKEANKWEVINIPFFAEENDVLGREIGARLWPEWFTEEMAEGIHELPPRLQAGLYQQRPAPEEGDYFKNDWLRSYDRNEYDALMVKECRIYGAGDWGVSEEKDANRTCLGGVAVDENKIIYVLPDLFWKVAGPKEVVASYFDFLKRRKPIVFWSEKGHISKAWGPFLREMMLDQDVYNYISEVLPHKAKDVRARSIQGMLSMHRVRFPAFAAWWPAAMHELLVFPGGRTDDFVDFLSHIGMGLSSMVKGTRPAIREEEVIHRKPVFNFAWLKQADYAKRRVGLPHYEGR